MKTRAKMSKAVKVCPIGLYQEGMNFDSDKCDYSPSTKTCGIACDKTLKAQLTKEAKKEAV